VSVDIHFGVLTQLHLNGIEMAIIIDRGAGVGAGAARGRMRLGFENHQVIQDKPGLALKR
jgi:hypothetical protein